MDRHLLEYANRAERASDRINKEIPSLKSLFKFKIEERLECSQSHKVRYSTAEETILRLPVDLNAAVNKEEVAAYEVLIFFFLFSFFCCVCVCV